LRATPKNKYLLNAPAYVTDIFKRDTAKAGQQMIELSRLNGKVFYLNHNLIEIFEETPDTVIKLTDGTKYVVREKIVEMLEKIVAFNRQIFAEKTRIE